MKKIDTQSGVPFYIQIADLIEYEIISGAFPSGSQIPSENTLVKKYGVCRATIRQAFQKLVDRGLLVKIRGRGTFVTHNWGTVEEIRVPENKLIAFLMRDSAGGVQPELIKSVSSAAFHAGYSLTVNNTGNSLEQALKYIQRIANQSVKGIVFRPLALSPFDEVNFRICEEIQKRRIPFVFIDIPVKDVPVSCIRSDNYQGGKFIGEMLREYGHRDVCVLLDCVNPTTDRRIEGLEKGLRQSASVVHYYKEIEGDFERKILKSLKGVKAPTAFFCIHDLIARQLLGFLRKQGIRVPDDISVAGFDDLDFSELLNPPLTTIHQNLDRIGQDAVRVLLRTIENPARQPSEILIPVQLIERESIQRIA